MSLSSRARRRRRASRALASRSGEVSAVSAASAPGAVGALGASQPLWQQYQRIGGNVTPAQVSAILYEADGGDIFHLIQLANEARQKDGHLQACLSQREQALADLPLSILPHVDRGRKKATRRDSKVADFVQDAIESAIGVDDEVRSFDDLIAHLQGAVYHGHAVAHPIYTRRRGLIYPVGFKLHNQRRFRFRLTDGKLVWSDKWGGTFEGVDLRRAYPGRFIIHQPRINGDAPPFEGLSRLLVWCALFRNWSLADWLKLAELSWKPWRIGKYSEKAGAEDRAKLWRILERLTSTGVALMRDDMSLDMKVPDGAGGRGKSNHAELCDFMGREMSKAILGQTLTMEAGDRGARSLGEVHNDVRKDIRNADAKTVAATLRRDFIAPLVRMNFGDVPIPRLAFDTEDAVDAEAFGKALGAFGKAGMRIPEEWAHDAAGVPLPKEGERVLGDPVDGESATRDPAQEETNDDGPPNEATPDEGAE